MENANLSSFVIIMMSNQRRKKSYKSFVKKQIFEFSGLQYGPFLCATRMCFMRKKEANTRRSSDQQKKTEIYIRTQVVHSVYPTYNEEHFQLH